ncbi:MAG TPA: glycosyltransferase, partial [Burkholderiaceae bacterium]|nr:glycosyltransferase [Burkholderiaceae bacterium]
HQHDHRGPMIPRVLHVIWVGDESKRPDNCIDTWRRHNPGWELRVWGNADLATYGWVNAPHMRAMSARELNGVADLMRWEILYNEGGFVVDADSVCQRPLEAWLFEGEACASWENELVRAGLIAAGYVGSVPQNPFFGQMILDLQNAATVVDRMAWQSVGPLFLTESHRKYQYSGLTVWPSHLFIPQHFSGARYAGGGPVFATQEWGSTLRNYDELYKRKIA